MYAEERYGEAYEASLALAEPLARPSSRGISWWWSQVDSVALVAAVQTFALSRILLLAITYLAMALHPEVWGVDHPPSSSFWGAWYQWDARWYVRVARSGYHFVDLTHWSSVAFFPLYPLLILAAVTVIPVSTKLIAMLVSNVLFLVLLYMLHLLVRREFDAKLASRTVLYLALFPTAIFFFAGYSESTLPLATVG